MLIDNRKKIIRANFSKAADYDKYSSYHKITMEMALESVKKFIAGDNCGKFPEYTVNILDIGCGTGEFYAKFSKTGIEGLNKFLYVGLDFAPGLIQKAKSKITAINEKLAEFNKGNIRAGSLLVNADGDHLPFKKEKFNIVVSNMTVHWLKDFPGFLGSVRDIITENGIAVLSFLIKGTLRELSEVFDRIGAGIDFRLHEFPAYEEIIESVKGANFKILESKKFKYIQKDENSLILLKRMSRIGAKNILNKKGLPVGNTRRLLQEYNALYGDNEGKVYATYNIAYLVLKKL